MTDPLLTDELGWHRVVGITPLLLEMPGRPPVALAEQLLVMACHITFKADPKALESGYPSAGAIQCDVCTKWVDPEGDGCTPPHRTYLEHFNAHRETKGES